MGRSNRDHNFREQPIADRNHRFTFGKYKGLAIDEVIRIDPPYLVWLHNASQHFELSSELLDEAEGVDAEFTRYREERMLSAPIAAPMTIRDVYKEFAPEPPRKEYTDDEIPF